MIERIIIENFKSIRKLDLELKPINILVGANGAGKSNFISFFRLTSVLRLRRLNFHYNIEKILYFGRKRSQRIKGEIYFDDDYVRVFTITSVENSFLSYVDKDYVYQKSEISLKEDSIEDNNTSYSEKSMAV